MGLAGPRKRVKLSHDPNNTTWTRDTAGFGHKIMTSQGWAPGEFLGAKNAPHSEMYTAANHSHIRVTLKDDNLGIGAKRGSGLAEGECTGLDVFQRLLGRLNGEDEEELAREQKSREDLRRAIYTERRWGSIRFVPGGLLIGDKIQDLIEGEAKRLRHLDGRVETENDSSPGSGSDTTPEPVVVKPKKKSKKKRRDEAVAWKDFGDATCSPSNGDKEERKLKKKKRRVAAETEDLGSTEESKKQKKKRKKSEQATMRSKEGDSGAKKSKKRSELSQDDAGRPVGQPSTPQSLLGGRHAVRSRNIAQKRLAVLDTASLNQIFMIKQ